MIEHPILFASVALAAIAAPGPTMLLALQNGARGGIRQALPGVAGAVLSDLLLIAAVAAGLGSLLLASALAFEVLKWLGVAYLCWLGIRLMRSLPAESNSYLESKCTPSYQVFRQCLLVAITNPKGYLFFSALLPSFINPAHALGPQYTTAALVFASLDALALCVYAGLGAAGARRASAATWRKAGRANGALLLMLAVSLSLMRRPGASGST
jgi:threonine/homoserine/homoserine lactone efflux protein